MNIFCFVFNPCIFIPGKFKWLLYLFVLQMTFSFSTWMSCDRSVANFYMKNSYIYISELMWWVMSVSYNLILLKFCFESKAHPRREKIFPGCSRIFYFLLCQTLCWRLLCQLQFSDLKFSCHLWFKPINSQQHIWNVCVIIMYHISNKYSWL